MKSCQKYLGSLTQNFKATKTVSPNFGLSFAKAYQNMKVWKKSLQNILLTLSYTPKMPFLAQICLIYPIFGDCHIFFKRFSNHPTFCPESVSACQKTSLIHHFVFGVCARKLITIWSFILDHFQPKLMTKFFEIRKKSHFWPILPIFGAMRIL